MDNFVTVVGRLVAEPELRFTGDGEPVAGFRIARNVRVRNNNGEWEDGRAQFFECSIFGRVAETVALMGKGMLVRVTGELDFREWETPEGDRRSKVSIKAKGVDGLTIGGQPQPDAEHFTMTWAPRPTEGANTPRPRSVAAHEPEPF